MTLHRIMRLRLLIIFAALIVPVTAPAQIIQIDPMAREAIPSSTEWGGNKGLITASERRGRNTEQSEPVEARIGHGLVPLRASHPQAGELPTFRLSGEVVSADFILFLPASPSDTELLISSRSGIDLLPAASSLRVTINGTFVGEIVPDNFVGFTEDRVAVPEGILQAGRNLVEFEARQTHRIACGPEASFALWTEIDASVSGVPMASSAFNTDQLGFLSAVAAQAALGQALEIRRPDPHASLTGAAPFIGVVANALGGEPPLIKSSSYWPLVGSSPALARIIVLPAGELSSGPRFERGGDGAVVLVLERDSDHAQISETLLAAANGRPEAAIRVLTPGVAHPLSDLQPRNLTGEGHYVFLDVPFQLPWDWLLLSSQKAHIDLDYRFAEGLPDGSSMLVKVNGTTVRLLPLDSGEEIDPPTLPISFEARLLQPGANQLAFEVLVPGDPVDRACATPIAPVVEISGTSLLLVPSSPGMELPSIDRSLARLSLDRIRLTEAAAGFIPPGFVPQLAAALEMQREGGSMSDNAGRLDIGTVADLEAMRPDWFGEDLTSLTRSLTEGTRRDRDGLPDAQLTAWDSVSAAEDTRIHPTSGLADLPQRMFSGALQFALGDGQPLETWLGSRAAQAAILQLDEERPGDLWLILGRQAVPDEIARSLAASSAAVGGPTGQVAIFTNAQEWESWTGPDRPLRLQEALTIATFRDVMGNYATHRPFGFLALVFAFTALSATAALAMLLVTRRRH